MHCFTLVVGEEVTRCIHIGVAKNAETTCPGIAVGKAGQFLPMSQDWFDHMVMLDQRALELPELKGVQLVMAPIANAALHEEVIGTEERDGKLEQLVRCSLVSRPRDELDRRALVHLIQPSDIKAKYSGGYKVEHPTKRKGTEEIRIARSYPKLRDTAGIEVLAEDDGDAVFTMLPGAAFRIDAPKGVRYEMPDAPGSTAPFLMYRLSPTGRTPNLVRLKYYQDKAA